MSDKTYTVAGTSIKKGEKKLRLANGTAAAREAVLIKDGHTEVRLFDLPQPMSADAAARWLEAQGDAVPVRAPKPTVEPTPRERTVKRLAGELARLMPRSDGPIPFDDLGHALYMSPKNMRIHAWEDCNIAVRQEFCRNAARKAGHATPRGMFPELEAFLADDGIFVNDEGELVQKAG
jgi:hypothetical protein